MNYWDQGNFFFLAGFSLFCWKNIASIRRDKKVLGFYWPTIVWTTTWGIYDLFYFPALGQWWSFTGELLIVTANVTWLSHVWYYWRTNENG